MSDTLQVMSSQVPANIEELVQFVKIGREKLTAVRAEIRAIEKLNLEDNRRKQALEQAQELSEALLDAEVRLGEIMSTLPEAQGKRTDLEHEDTDDQKSKKEILKEAGFSVKTAQRYELLARYPEIVAQMKAQAREKASIVSRTAVLRAIELAQVPQVDEDELETPQMMQPSIHRVLGFIDLDPAAPVQWRDEIGNDSFIRKFYTKEENGLIQPWEGNVYLYPPRSNIEAFVDKLIESQATVTQAIVYVPNEPGATWFEKLADYSQGIVFIRNRENQCGMVAFYIGNHVRKFFNEFVSFGWGIELKRAVHNELTYQKS